MTDGMTLPLGLEELSRKKQILLEVDQDVYERILDRLRTTLEIAPLATTIRAARQQAMRQLDLSPEERTFMNDLRARVPKTPTAGAPTLKDVERYALERHAIRRREVDRVLDLCSRAAKAAPVTASGRKASVKSVLVDLIEYALANAPLPDKSASIPLSDLLTRIPAADVDANGIPFRTEAEQFAARNGGAA